MRLPSAAALRSPVARASAFYFAFFMTAAVSNPYLAIWLTSKGIGPSGIGIINAMPFLVMILINQAVGRIADKAGDWRSTIVIGSVLAAVAPVGLLVADDYLGILVVWVLVIVPFQAIAPVADAATIRMTRRVGAEFSLVRVWGTVGFVVMTICAGVMLEHYGGEAFVPLLIIAALLRAALSLQLPLFRAPALAPDADASELSAVSPLVATRLRQVWRPWFLLPLIGVALLHGSHMMQMAFGALIWQQAGIPASVIGPLWAVGPAGEVLVMLLFARLARRFTARHLILAACLVAVVRWIGFALEPPLWVLVMLQLSNMVTFGLSYLGIVNFVANWTSEDIAAEAQGFFTVLRQVVQVVALTAFGFLTAEFAAGAYLGASAMAVAAAVLTFASLLLMPARQEKRNS